jgi:hypothetical protein
MDELKPVFFSRSPNAAQPQVRHAHTLPFREGQHKPFWLPSKAARPGLDILATFRASTEL